MNYQADNNIQIMKQPRISSNKQTSLISILPSTSYPSVINSSPISSVSPQQQLLASFLISSSLQLSTIQKQLITKCKQFQEQKAYAIQISDQDLYLENYLKKYEGTRVIGEVMRNKMEQREIAAVEEPQSSSFLNKITSQILPTSQNINSSQLHRIETTENTHRQSSSQNYNHHDITTSRITKTPSTDLPQIRSFLRSIQQKQRSVRQRVEKSYQLEAQNRSILKQQEQQSLLFQKKERIRLRRQKQQEKRRLRQKQKQQLTTKEQEFKQFVNKLNIYPKPLYQLKRQEQIQMQNATKQQMKKRVRQIKLKAKPIDGQELLKHEHQYQKRKAEQQMMRLNRIQGLMSQRDIPTPASLFRGRFYQAETQKDGSKEERQKEQRANSIKERISHFNDMVRQNYKPKIDQRKKIELMNYLEFQKQRQKVRSSMSSYEYSKTKQDSRVLGNKYLDQLKRLTPQLRLSTSKKPQSQKFDVPNSKLNTTLSKKEQTKKYLSENIEELKIKKKSNSWKKDLQSKQLSVVEKYQSVLLKAGRLEEEAFKKEKHLMMEDKRTMKAIEMAESIDDCYLNSIEARLQLISKLREA